MDLNPRDEIMQGKDGHHVTSPDLEVVQKGRYLRPCIGDSDSCIYEWRDKQDSSALHQMYYQHEAIYVVMR